MFEVNRVSTTKPIFTNRRLLLDNAQVIYISLEGFCQCLRNRTFSGCQNNEPDHSLLVSQGISNLLPDPNTLLFFFFLFKDLQSMIEPCYKKLINLTCLGSVLKDLWQWFILSLETYSQTFHINWLVVIFLGFIPQFSKITPFMYWLQSVSFDQRITLPLLIFYSGVWINLFLQVLSWLVSRVRVIQCRH